MPSNSPDFMTLLSKHNNKHGITTTVSELKKSAAAIRKAYYARPDHEQIDPLAYVLQYRDDTGEEATDGYDTERERNRVAAAQRIARRTA
jgi:hypothetical protein